MNSVPDYVPMLRAGATKTPQLGGCIVQIANWLASPTIWTDYPVHVHPVLAFWAIRVNDHVCHHGTEQNRRQLALLAPRLTDTGSANQYMSYVFEDEELRRWMNANPTPIYKTYPGLNVIIRNVDMAPTVQWLSDLLDVFDRVKGRTPTPELSRERWDQVRQLVGQ